MNHTPYQCKKKAREALRGNWQTALLVCFFSNALSMLFNLATEEIPLQVEALTLSNLYPTALSILQKTPTALLFLILILGALHLFFSPVLQLGASHYFVARMQGTELWFRGLLSRITLWGKALKLSLYMALKIFLWSLLFILPGILAAIRYSMSYYFLAEEPSLSVKEAVKKSKQALKGLEWHYLLLELSVLGWLFLPFLFSMALYDIHPIVALVAFQFSNLAVNTYIQGIFAAFFQAVRSPQEETI